MKHRCEIDRLIVTKQRRLQKRKEQAALYGSTVDPHILIEIEDLESEIEDLCQELAEIDTKGNINDFTDDLDNLPENNKRSHSNSKTYIKKFFQSSITQLIIFSIVGIGLFVSLSNTTPPTCRDISSQTGHIRVLVSHNEDNKIRWWVGQDGLGLRTFTCPLDRCTETNFSPSQTFLETSLVLDLTWNETRTSPNEIWVSTAQGELVKLIKESNQWTKTDVVQQKYCSANAIVTHKGDLYLGPADTNQAEIYTFNKLGQWDVSDRFRLPQDSRLQVKELVFDSTLQTLWIATTVGLFKMSDNQPSYILYNDEASEQYFSTETVVKDNKGGIWVGTQDKGLLRYNPSLNKWTKFTGLPSRHITSISLSPLSKMALIGTDNGLGICLWDKSFSNQCMRIDDLDIQEKIDVTSLTNHDIALIGMSNKLVAINNPLSLID